MKKAKVIFLLSLVLLFSVNTNAADVSFNASIDKSKISLGSNIKLSLTLHNAQNVSHFNLPDIQDCTIRYIGPSTMMSVVNGEVTSSTTHNYSLTPQKIGNFVIGPFSVDYQGNAYQSDSLNVEIVSGPVTGTNSSQTSNNSLDLEERALVKIIPAKDKVYLKEVIPLVIKLYTRGIQATDIQYPQFEQDGLFVGEYGQPRQYSEVLNGLSYRVVEFNTRVFGTRSGEFAIGPVNIQMSVAVKKKQQRRGNSAFDDFFRGGFNDFFQRYQTYPVIIKSGKAKFSVLPLPENSPKSFKGAVGNFRFNVDASPTSVNVGDPITMKMVVSGQGNFDTVGTPWVGHQEDFKVYKPQVTVGNNQKTFEQIFMPKDDKSNQLPLVEFSFFNPNDKQYKTISKGPISIEVKPLEKGGELKILENSNITQRPLGKEKIGRGIVYIKNYPGKIIKQRMYLYNNKLFLFSGLLPLIILSITLIFYSRREKIKSDYRYARRINAFKKAKIGLKRVEQYLKQNKQNEFYNDAFKTFQEYLGDKLHLPPGEIVLDKVKEILKNKNVKKEVLLQIEETFKKCDFARYAPLDVGTGGMENTFRQIKIIINSLQKQKI